MSKKTKIKCPCCEKHIRIDMDWWKKQSTNITECPICLSIIMIDDEDMVAVNYRKYLTANYKRFESPSKKKFLVKEPDLISYITAEEWPESWNRSLD